MTKYAQNLIGDWETEQFEPLRQVAQNRYQTDWDKLSSDFANLNEQLAQNFKNARIKHNAEILDNYRNSYNRMYNVEQDLATRGLTGSGLLNVYDATNTKQLGQENNVALQELMDANKANVEGRFSGLDTYAKNLSKLSGDLGDTLAGITDAEGENLREYRNLLSSISESAASRNSEYAIKQAEDDLEKLQDDLYQFLAIKDILADEETTADEKYYDLVRDAGVTPEQAEKIVSSYNYEQTSEKIKTQQEKLNKSQEKVDKYENAKVMNSLATASGVASLLLHPYFALIPAARGIGYGVTKATETSRKNKLEKSQKDLNNYTYQDLKDIMGY